MAKSSKFTTADVKNDPAAQALEALGPALKKARRIRHMTLKELAKRADCSISLLSKIENGKATPSFRMATNICAALKVRLATLLEEDVAPRVVTKAGHHPVVEYRGGLMRHILPPRPEHHMEAFIVEREPRSRGMQYSHGGDGEMLGYVLEGSVELEVDGKKYKVKEGDSFLFPYGTKHRISNTTGRLCRVFLVASPPVIDLSMTTERE